jgi:hypothetical protein
LPRGQRIRLWLVASFLHGEGRDMAPAITHGWLQQAVFLERLFPRGTLFG